MNSNIALIEGITDPLLDRYNELALTQEIPSLAIYAYEWQMLATQAEGENRPALAEMCVSRAEFYGRQEEGEYIRLINLPFSELIKTG